MGNSSKTINNETVDIINTMSHKQRVDHLVAGYIKINYRNQFKKYKSKFKYIPVDILHLLYEYIGSDSDFIKSDTEIQIEEESLNKNKEYDLRIFVVGARGVGKTSLITRFVADSWAIVYDTDFEDSYRKYWRVDDYKFIFDVMDVPGNEEFSAMRDSFLREFNYMIFVYSINDRSTFKEIIDIIEKQKRVCNLDTNDWQNKKFGIICGNKCDLEYDRTVTKEEGEKLAEELGPNIGFIETSTKNNTDIYEPFNECARMYIRNEIETDDTIIEHKCCVLL